MRALILMLALGAAAQAAAASADPKTVKEVEAFVKAENSALTPALIERMMALDEKTLPAKLGQRLVARRLELQTLRQLGEGKRKGTVRIPDDKCAIPSEAKSDDSRTLVMAGFVKITDDEEQAVEDRTHCTERDMMCEFSLQIVVKRDPKTQKVKTKEYFLHPNDPLMAVVAAYRAKLGGNTPFFSSAAPVCSR